MKHTPGPWDVIEKINSTADSYSIATLDEHSAIKRLIAITPNYYDREQDKANAHLIAAATDMFNALECVIESLDNGGFGIAYAKDVAKLAIAKAKGEKE